MPLLCAPPTLNTVIVEQLIASEIEVKVHHYVIRYYTTSFDDPESHAQHSDYFNNN